MQRKLFIFWESYLFKALYPSFRLSLRYSSPRCLEFAQGWAWDYVSPEGCDFALFATVPLAPRIILIPNKYFLSDWIWVFKPHLFVRSRQQSHFWNSVFASCLSVWTWIAKLLPVPFLSGGPFTGQSLDGARLKHLMWFLFTPLGCKWRRRARLYISTVSCDPGPKPAERTFRFLSSHRKRWVP